MSRALHMLMRAVAASAPPPPPPPPPGDWPTLETAGLATYGGSLTSYTGGNITVDNTTITGKILDGSTVDIFADNVTFQHCRVASSTPIAIAVQPGQSGLTLIGCDLVSGGFIAPVSGTSFVDCRSDPSIGHRVDDLVLAWSSVGHNGDTILIQDCYFGPQWGFGPAEDPDHTDALQFFGFGTISGLTIDHNTFDSTNVSGEPGATANGAGIFAADGSYENVTITDNFFTRTDDVAGYYHCRLLSDSDLGGHVITGNRFGQQGAVEAVQTLNATVVTWSDNLYWPSLDPVPAP